MGGSAAIGPLLDGISPLAAFGVVEAGAALGGGFSFGLEGGGGGFQGGNHASPSVGG